MTISKEITAAPQDIHAYLTELVKKALTDYLEREGLALDPGQLPIDLRFSAQASFGDYSMPVMPWSGKKRLGRPAMTIAEALGELLRGTHDLAIGEITV